VIDFDAKDTHSAPGALRHNSQLGAHSIGEWSKKWLCDHRIEEPAT